MEEFDNDAPDYRGPEAPPEYPQQQRTSQTLGDMQQQPSSGPEKHTNVMAILSLIFSFFIGLLGVIFGIIALNQIKNNPGQKGKGLAIAGIIIGAVGGIVIILIMIGGMAYFGVLSPSTMLPTKCVVSPGFDCVTFTASTDGTVNLMLHNGIGQDIQKATISMGSDCTPKDTYWGLNQQAAFVCKSTPGKSGESFKGDFTLTYTEVGGQFPQTASGSLMVRYS